MLLALAFASVVGAAPADSVPGTWQLKGDVMGNPVSQRCTIKRAGAALSGSCLNDAGEVREITGEVKDGKISFKHGGDYQGQALTITYTATMPSPTELKGTIDVLPFGVNGTFTATPAPAAPAKP